MRKAICVAIIENSHILLVRKKKVWILPGGKPESGESDIQCLFREIREELPQLILRDLKYFNCFVGTTPHKGDKLRAEVYCANSSGDTIPRAEINAAKWTAIPERDNLSNITRKIILSLRQKGYL